jgi:serine/threonine protein phosphatase PrpC
MRFADGARSDVGRGRPENEDSVLVDRDHHLYAVADGMGGHRGGEVASATAIETLRAAYGGGQRLAEAMESANAAVFAKAADDVALRGMGTTLTAVALEDGHTALLGHVGDSRAYLMRNGTVTQVTDDHSLVEQLVREGRLSPEEAHHHPQRAIITRALGVDPEVEVDTYRLDLKPGDRILICSDGLTNMLSDDIIATTLRRHADPQQAADILVDMANQAGGDDNITVVVLDALSDGGTAESESQPEPVAPVVEPEADEGPLDGPPVEPSRPAPAEGPPRRRVRGVVRWGLPIVAVVGIALGAVGWYARRTYYVGLSSDRVTLFKGVPGGLLGWNPTVDRRIDLTAADLTPAERADLENGHRFASRSGAIGFLTRLEQAHPPAAGSPPELHPVGGDPTSQSTTGTTR